MVAWRPLAAFSYTCDRGRPDSKDQIAKSCALGWLPRMFAPALGSNPFAMGGWVLFEPVVLETIGHFRQDTKNKSEAGGILLGFRRGPHLHVVEATTPTNRDRRSRTGFERSAEIHRHIAMCRWQDTGGTMDYLGEWHTHPEANPSPSGIDLAAWNAIYATRPHRSVIFVVAGNSNHCWFGVAQASTLRHLPFGHDVLRDAE